jgi:hypothetical protein
VLEWIYCNRVGTVRYPGTQYMFGVGKNAAIRLIFIHEYDIHGCQPLQVPISDFSERGGVGSSAGEITLITLLETEVVRSVARFCVHHHLALQELAQKRHQTSAVRW